MMTLPGCFGSTAKSLTMFLYGAFGSDALAPFVTVTYPDLTGPQFIEDAPITQLRVDFSEPMSAASASDLASVANPNNYSVGRQYGPLNFIIIHDTEGSYYSAISWFQNTNAIASAHYVIRSSDGQITQMVRRFKGGF